MLGVMAIIGKVCGFMILIRPGERLNTSEIKLNLKHYLSNKFFPVKYLNNPE